MKNSTATALGAQAASNVVFLNLPQTRKRANPTTTKGPGTFSELPHGTPKNRKKEGKDTEYPLSTERIGELRRKFPSEWNSFSCMKYERCGKDGGYVCHPSINTFPKFLRAFGPKPDPTYTLDRHDPSDPEYSPEKCDWACKKGQTANRRNTVYLAHSDGTCLSVAEWSRRSGVKLKTIHERIRRGWSVDDAVRPARPQQPRAINCKTGGNETDGMTLEEFCAQPQKSDAGPIAPLLEMWKKALAEQYDSPFFVVEPKHIRMLKDVARLLSDGGLDPEKVLACVLENWGGQRAGFARYAMDRGAHKAPRQPCLQYLRAYVNHAANF